MKIAVTATPDELRAASQIAKNCTLVDIRLARIELDNRLVDCPDVLPEHLTVDIRRLDVGHSVSNAGVLTVKTGVELLFLKDGGEVVAPGEARYEVRCVIVMAAQYQLPAGPPPPFVTEESFRQFARINGPYNCWPYLREEIHRLSTNMGVTVRIPLLVVETPNADDEGKTAPTQR